MATKAPKKVKIVLEKVKLDKMSHKVQNNDKNQQVLLGFHHPFL
jgi:hypothetical protein